MLNLQYIEVWDSKLNEKFKFMWSLNYTLETCFHDILAKNKTRKKKRPNYLMHTRYLLHSFKKKKLLLINITITIYKYIFKNVKSLLI